MSPGSRLRVLHVSQPVVDGVAVVVGDLSEALHADGAEVAVACPQEGYLPARLRDIGVPSLAWSASRNPGPSTASETLQLRRLIGWYRPDVVHLHSSKAGLAGRLALRGRLPTVFSPHAWSFFHLEGRMRSAALAWERFGARWADIILCGSIEEEQAGRDAGITGHYQVIANSSTIDNPGLSRADARRSLELPVDDDTPLAICLGRFTRQKGQDVLLRAWPQVHDALPGARLVVVGHGEDRAMLEELAPSDVIFREAPQRTGVATWMLASDVMVFPSRWETLSLAVLEALQLGRPVVVSDCGGMREALAGGAGAMVPAEDVPALAQALIPFLADRPFAAEQGQAAAAAYRRVHEPRRQANMQAYEQLLRGLSG